MLTTKLLLVMIGVIICATCSESDDSFFSGIKVMYRAFKQCDVGDLMTCLKLRVAKALDNVVDQNEVSVIEGVSFQKVGNDNETEIEEPLTEVNESSLPDDPSEREEAVDELITERLSRFYRTHSLKIGFGTEGRGSGGGLGGGGGGGGKKGGGGVLLLGAMMAGGMGAIMMGGIALIAGKALLVAKVALVISAIIGLHKLTHQSHEESHKVISTGHGGYDRIGRFRRDADSFRSHYLAYNGQLNRSEK